MQSKSLIKLVLALQSNSNTLTVISYNTQPRLSAAELVICPASNAEPLFLAQVEKSTLHANSSST